MRQALVLILGLACRVSAGCTEEGGAASPQSLSSAPLPESNLDILQADAADPAIQAALVATVRDSSACPQRRYLSLRRLEETDVSYVQLASEVALDPATAEEKDARFLRTNAVALLIRAQSAGRPGATDALEELRRSPAVSDLVTRLSVQAR
jgi:hypothetical protein